MVKTEYISNTEKDTVQLGKEFAKNLKPGEIVALSGALGTGKTEFIKGICKHFDVHEIVTSPTFTLINQYDGKLDGDEISIYHIDLYRIKEKKELDEIGLDECLASENSIKLIEWAEKADIPLTENLYKVNINYDPEDENKRIIHITH